MLGMLGISPWTLIAVGIMLAVTNGISFTGGYKFGSDRQKVLCQVRVDKINEQINAANLAITQAEKRHADELAKLEAEGEAETQRADEAEALNNVALGAFEDEVSKRIDKCPVSGDDARRLR